MKKASLIALTGIDGSGKTTQAKILVEGLKKEGIDVSYVWSRWEPFFLRPLIRRWKDRVENKTPNSGYNDLKGRKQKLLNNPILRWSWLVGFFIDYGVQIFVKVRIKLLKRQLIVSDRTFYDSLIDQTINLGERGEGLLNCIDSSWINVFFPKPNLVIYIDCPEGVAYERNMAKKDTQGIEYLKERRRLYLRLADRYGWVKIDGTLPIDKLAQQIKEIVYKELAI